jgi:hypothetical protein
MVPFAPECRRMPLESGGNGSNGTRKLMILRCGSQGIPQARTANRLCEKRHSPCRVGRHQDELTLNLSAWKRDQLHFGPAGDLQDLIDHQVARIAKAFKESDCRPRKAIAADNASQLASRSRDGMMMSPGCSSVLAASRRKSSAFSVTRMRSSAMHNANMRWSGVPRRPTCNGCRASCRPELFSRIASCGESDSSMKNLTRLFPKAVRPAEG